MLRERFCDRCGKVFVPAPKHVYKDLHRRLLFCSYTCDCHRDEVKSVRTKRIVQYSLSGAKKHRYNSAKEAAAAVGGDAQGVRYACREDVPYMGYLWAYYGKGLRKRDTDGETV